MPADRFTKALLIVIALELFWLGAANLQPVAAQDAATPVVITGIVLAGQEETGRLPISLNGPITIEAQQPVAVRPDGPVTVRADEPLPVRNVPADSAARPGL